jgi:hypothetical protein
MKRIKLFVVLVAIMLLALLTGAALAQEPEAITAFTIAPNTAIPGESITYRINFTVPNTEAANTICLYYTHVPFQSVLNAVGDLTSNLGDVYIQTSGAALGNSTTNCPASATRFVDEWTVAAPDDFADGGDYIEFTISVPNDATPGTKTFTSRQRQNVTTINTLNATMTVNEAPPPPTVVYASSVAGCGGNTPCFSTVQAAVDAVAGGGTVNLSGSFSESPSIGKSLLVQPSGSATIAGTTQVTAGDVTFRGLTLNGSPAINNSGGTVTAYANNIIGGITAGSGSYSHNWWGSYTVQPSGVSNDDWGKRLGAAVEGYGIGSLGLASVTGGTGTAVVVSHGRGHTNAPFGHATAEDGNTQCSDYYDFFVASGSGGNWLVSVPIDNRPSCDIVYTSKTLFEFRSDPGLPGWRHT